MDDHSENIGLQRLGVSNGRHFTRAIAVLILIYCSWS